MTIAEEAQRYLAVVEFFRAEGFEPRWRPETHSERTERSSTTSPTNSERRKSCNH
jgi:hypothetical protein